MKNKPKFLASKMNITSATTKDYENVPPSHPAKTIPTPPRLKRFFHNSKLKISHSPWSEACPYLIGGAETP
jgi:hypothetical protein